jgi:hypothetical protein
MWQGYYRNIIKSDIFGTISKMMGHFNTLKNSMNYFKIDR